MNRLDRRTFLLAGLTLACPAEARPGAVERRRAAVRVRAQSARLETFREWLDAPAPARERALQACVDRIRSMDASIQAWVQVLPQPPTGTGPLSGIPFGAKDIIETKGLATEYGSPIYKGRVGTEDAAIVRELRRRGAVLLGKTQSTAFAYRTPAPTHNPRNLQHTPGGSSAGSAAAVAAGMVPLAIGTQTGGSVLRPASFCGVTGFKTTYGLLSMEGVFPLAKSFDTLGFFTHTAADMLAFWESMGHASGAADDLPVGIPDPLPEVDAPMAIAFRSAADRLKAAHVASRPIDIAGMLNSLQEAHRTVMVYEGARLHEERFKQYGARLQDIADMVRDGLKIPAPRYEEALRHIAECRTKAAELFKATPIILVPAAPGPAPFGLTSTGDSRMNAPWSALGTPAISIPMPVGTALPLGLQLTAARGEDARLLRAAVRLERALA